MNKIYIILMHTNTMPSKIVKTFTRYKYSHVAIALDKSCNTLYSFGRKKVNSIINGGFVVTEKTGEFFKKFNKTECKIYELSISDEQYLALKNILETMEEHEQEYKYDFCGTVLRFFKIPITFKNKYVCSYFVAYLLNQAKIYNFNKKLCFVYPKDFENIQESSEIYHGSYITY
ncbi:MAG: hypothetical protein IKV94_00650 [Clostridia bacterium]|nr:hypothetical protein [Clostridia bacterium]